jgi:hypothetical protein
MNFQFSVRLTSCGVTHMPIAVSRDSSVGIVTGYGLDDGGGGISSPFRVKKFSLLHIVKTGSGVHPTSYKIGTGGKAAGA